MIDEQWLIDLIKSETSYTDVRFATDTQVDLINTPSINPIILVGHLGIQLEKPEDMRADGFHEMENDEVLSTSIQFICPRTDLVTVRTNIKAAYSGKSPFPLDSNYSSMIFMQAGVIAKTNTKIWWQEIVGLIMPRIT